MDVLSNHGFLGALAGLVLGLADYVVITMFAQRKAQSVTDDRLGQRRISSVLNLARLSSLVGLPAVGYVVGPMVLPAFMGN